MTQDELIKIIEMYRDGEIYMDSVLTAVEAYSSASNNGKPLVSGRSELLLAFAEWIAKDTITGLLGTPEYYVERFLKANNSH